MPGEVALLDKFFAIASFPFMFLFYLNATSTIQVSNGDSRGMGQTVFFKLLQLIKVAFVYRSAQTG